MLLMTPISGPTGPLLAAARPNLRGLSGDLLKKLEVPFKSGEQIDVLRAYLEPLAQVPIVHDHIGLSPDNQKDLAAYTQPEGQPTVDLLGSLLEISDTLKMILDVSSADRGPEGTAAAVKHLQAKAAELAALTASSDSQEVPRIDHNEPPSLEKRLEGVGKDAAHLIATAEEAARLAEAQIKDSDTPVPPAYSLEEILKDPEQFKKDHIAHLKKSKKPVEHDDDGRLIVDVAGFDVDGCTHDGQFWLKAIGDAVRYWPVVPVGPNLLFFGTADAVRLRLQEKNEGEADEDAIGQALGNKLKGFRWADFSNWMDGFYEEHGKRNLSTYMREQFRFHRRNHHLIIGLSATMEYIVRRHAEDMAIPAGNVFGTFLEVDAETGLLTGYVRPMRSDTKVKTLEEKVTQPLLDAGIRPRVKWFYSDSPSDIPCFERTLADKGKITATSPPKADFAQWTLDRGGQVVYEEHSARAEGLRRIVHVESSDMGRWVREVVIPPRSSQLPSDLKEYSLVAGRSAAAFGMAGTALFMGADWMQGGYEAVEYIDSLAAGATMAVSGGLGSMAGYFVTPKRGRATELRKWFTMQSAPLTAAMITSGATITAYNFWGPDVLASVAVLSGVVAGATNLTGRFSRYTLRAFGLKQVDKFAETVVGQAMARAIQVPAVQGLILWINQIAS